MSGGWCENELTSPERRGKQPNTGWIEQMIAAGDVNMTTQRQDEDRAGKCRQMIAVQHDKAAYS
jgi:hypothetical protein